jgi:hypothetical protein
MFLTETTSVTRMQLYLNMGLSEKEVKEKLLPGELGVSPRLIKVPQRMGDLGGSVIVPPFQGG